MAGPTTGMRTPTTEFVQPPLHEGGWLLPVRAYRSPVATGRAGSAHHSLHEPG